MRKSVKKERPSMVYGYSAAILAGAILFGVYVVSFANIQDFERVAAAGFDATSSPPAVLDRDAYDLKLWGIAYATSSDGARHLMQQHLAATTSTSTKPKKLLWPVKTVYPNANALLPFNRIVAYYGNFYSKGMGVLGEYPTDVMIAKLRAEVAKWQAADPATPVLPAIDYIAVTAQASPVDGTYRARMPDSQIDHALDLARQVNGIVILDVQVGLSTLPKELPLLAKYLALPNVHLAIDPEFSMKDGVKPGREIGTYDAVDVNYAANFLATLVRANNLPPKILIVHRFTEAMVTHYKSITPLPEVQIVMDMDGWGSPAKKIGTYTNFISPEPVQFTGFKLFYKNDIKPPSTRLMTPAELLKLKPQPVFIQYQ